MTGLSLPSKKNNIFLSMIPEVVHAKTRSFKQNKVYSHSVDYLKIKVDLKYEPNKTYC